MYSSTDTATKDRRVVEEIISARLEQSISEALSSQGA